MKHTLFLLAGLIFAVCAPLLSEETAGNTDDTIEIIELDTTDDAADADKTGEGDDIEIIELEPGENDPGIAHEQQEKGLAVRGALRSDILFHHTIRTNSEGVYDHALNYAGMTTFFLVAENKRQARAKFEADIMVTLLYGEYADAVAEALGETSLSFGDAPFFATIRKLYIRLSPSFADITFGRQIINFGKGMLFSPIDVFSSVDLTDLSFERTGSDILLAKFYFGATAGLDVVGKFTTDLADMTGAVKLYANVFDVDLSLVGIYKAEAPATVIGATFKGDLIVGVYGEGVLHIQTNGTDVFFEAMAGFDYSFLDDAFTFVCEYRYNGRPVDGDALTPSDVATLQRIFLGEHYLFFSLTYMINEITTLSGNVIWNVAEEEVMGTLSFYYNLFQNTDFTTYVRYQTGDINGVSFLDAYDLEYAFRIEVAF